MNELPPVTPGEQIYIANLVGRLTSKEARTLIAILKSWETRKALS